MGKRRFKAGSKVIAGFLICTLLASVPAWASDGAVPHGGWLSGGGSQ